MKKPRQPLFLREALSVTAALFALSAPGHLHAQTFRVSALTLPDLTDARGVTGAPLIAQATGQAQVALPEPVAGAPAGAPAAPAANAPAAAPNRNERPTGPGAATQAGARDGIQLNFKDASLPDVLNYLSEAAGFVIVQEVPVTGTVNVVSRQSVNADEAVDLLNAVLVEKGYIALRSGRILKIVSRQNAQKRDLPVQTGSDPEMIPRKDDMVTQILPVRYGDAAKLVENLRPLLPETATISANEGSNAILMTDTQTNIRRIAQIIRAVDTSVSGISSIRVYALQFADAKELATIITQLFASGQTPRGGGGDDGRDRGGFGGFGDRGRGGGRPTAVQSEARMAAARVVAVADEQSNSVVVSAPDDVIPTITEIVTQIDTSITDVTESRIFRLLHADAVELADLVNSLYSETLNQSGQNGRRGDRGRDDRGDRGDRGGDRGGGQPGQRSQRALLQSQVVAVGDPRTNSLVVTAARETMIEISEMIGRLDSTDAKKQRVFVHSLEHADVDGVASVLRGMLGGPNANTAQPTASRLTERSTTGATMDTAETSNTGRAGNR